MKSSLLLPLALPSGCAQFSRRPPHLSKPKAPVVVDAAPELAWEELEKINTEEAADGHAIVEAQEPEEKIAEAVGGDADAELEAPEETTPTPRPFLRRVRTKRVKFWIDYFTQNQKSRERFQRFLNNGAMYRPIIEKIFDEEGVPRELFYVGLIESGYYLGAHSHAAAVGPWQFIRGTGKRYGLAITGDHDERRDIFKATTAAAQYFHDLHSIFSSWELALAAYNAGEYGLVRRITRYKTRDYYELSRQGLLPKETINYVPKVLAAMHVTENAKRYGFHLPEGTSLLWEKTKLIRAPKGVPLRTIGQRWELSPTLLAKLNPELRRGRTPTHIRGAYHLRVPATRHTEWMAGLESTEDEVNPRLQEIARLKDRVLNPEAYHVPYVVPRRPASVAHTKRHKVRRGETLSSIARRHRLTVRELIALNSLSARGRIQAGQTLKLKGAPAVVTKTVAKRAPRPAKRTVAQTAEPLMLKLTKGDTLTDVSRWFGVSVAALKKANGIVRGRNIHAGKLIKIPHKTRSTYTVRRGDGLIKVARKFGLHQDALMRLNNLKRAQLFAGQRLVVVSRI